MQGIGFAPVYLGSGWTDIPDTLSVQKNKVFTLEDICICSIIGCTAVGGSYGSVCM